MKNIVILGSTGSIGTSALDVIRQHPDKFKVLALVAGSNIALLEKQVAEFRPEFTALKKDGEEAAIEAATLKKADIVLSAIVGAAGLKPTYAALQAGKTVALANKESLVAAGPVMIRACEKGKGKLLPVDSEHSAIHQVWNGRKEEVSKIILTASGGPFLNTPKEELKKVTPLEALKHPNWSMGKKVTIDSATLMNKGLEMIEARWLFGMEPEKISVVVHPQSIVHSFVEYIDGSVLAQLGVPDMRIPIAYALGFPERITTSAPSLNLTEMGGLNFFKPDAEKFPCLRLAREALEQGDSYPCVLNAANEVAVAAFLERKISFTGISTLVEKVLSAHQSCPLNSLEDVLETDRWGREYARTMVRVR